MPLFSKHAKIKEYACEDGVTLEVPQEEDDALSTYLTDQKISGGGKLDFATQFNVKGNAEYQTTLKSVSDIYNERNANLLIEFKLHYKLFRYSPCLRYKDFFRQVDDLLEGRKRIENFRLGILALAPLFESEVSSEIIHEKIAALQTEFVQTREEAFVRTLNDRIKRVEDKQAKWAAL